jgi:3-oxoacyl-[acyl-carrier protein] reductase
VQAWHGEAADAEGAPQDAAEDAAEDAAQDAAQDAVRDSAHDVDEGKAPAPQDVNLDLPSAAQLLAALIDPDHVQPDHESRPGEREPASSGPDLAPEAQPEPQLDLGLEPGPGYDVVFGDASASRVALVTGAGRGIGRAIAVGLGQAGVSVALLGRSPEALERVAAQVAAYGVRVSWAGADVRDYAQVQLAVERLEAAVGEVDLLVNSAGVIEPAEVPVWEAGPETWWHVVETDLRGPFHCVRAVVPGMVERGGGRVVNLSSGIGVCDRDIYSAYAAAKAGQFRITGSLHLAGFDRGLRAFEISPGVVRTDMTATMAIHAGRQDWTPVERVVELVVAVAAGRLDAWSGGFLRAGVDSLDSLEGAELKAGEKGLPPTARRLGILFYDETDPLGGCLRSGE